MPVLSAVLGFDDSNSLNWMVLAHFSDHFVLELIELFILSENNVTADPPSPQPPHTHTHTHALTHTHAQTQATVRLVLVASSFSVPNYCNRNCITFLYEHAQTLCKCNNLGMQISENAGAQLYNYLATQLKAFLLYVCT